MKKKIFSILLIAVMVLSSFATVFAAVDETPHEIVVSDSQKGTHTYDAYKIFKGKLNADGVLEEIDWAEGAASTLPAALKADATLGNLFKDCTDAPSFAKVIGELANDATKVEHLADVISDNLGDSAGTTDKDGKVTVTGDGWYFIKDVTVMKDQNGNTLAGFEGDALSDYMLQVVGDTAITAKSETVESDKKVKEKNDTTGTESGWQDAADYDIGDKVPFRLRGTVAKDYDKYTKYTYKFHDKQSDGLGAPEEVEVYYKNKGDANETKIESGWTLVTTGLEDDCTFEIVFNGEKGLKEIEGIKAEAEIFVYYKSELTADCVIGGPDGNPNESRLEYSNNPNDEGEGTGTTPWDKVTVFTYEIIANKTGDGGKALEGAGFTLYKKVAEGTEGAADLYKLDNVNEGTVSTTEKYEGKYVVVSVIAPGSGKTQFKWTGEDAGEYVLRESVIPTGYNGAQDVTFTVKATYDTTSTDPKLTNLTCDPASAQFTCTLKDVTTSVANKSGSTLPETGGMGTTIIYILGAALVIGAGVVLVSRKRTNDR